MVEAIDPKFLFSRTREFPPPFNPSMVTLSAPFRSINGPGKLQASVLPPFGLIRTELYDA